MPDAQSAQPAGQPRQPAGQPSQPDAQPAQPAGLPSQAAGQPSPPVDERSQLGDQLLGFFDVFSRSSSSLDLDALSGCFDETFLASDAAGATVVPRAAFLQALPRRAQAFADAGVGPAALRQLTHQELDDHHVLARTAWAARRTDGSGDVMLDSSFLLRRDGDRLRVVVYITHQGLRP